MKLDDVEQRHKIIDDLIQQAFKNDEIFIQGEENYYEWLSNIRIMTDLTLLEEMLRSERIFCDVLADLQSVNVDNAADKIPALNIAHNKLRDFVETVLLPLFDNMAVALCRWQFKTERGKKFHRNVNKKIDALIEYYQKLYDL